MNSIKIWWLRGFCVISNQQAKELGLKHMCNIYGDEINKLECRSLWQDEKERVYRVKNLHYEY
jgi:hypothetical protein